MPLDTRIALGGQPLQLENPLAQYGKLMSVVNAGTQNQLAQMQMSAAQREQESVNALNQAYASAYDPATGKIDPNKLRASVAQAGFGSKLPGIEKTLVELDKERSLLQKTQGEVAAQPTALAKQQVDLLDAKLKQSRAFLDTLDPADPNAPARYLQWHEANHADPIIGPALKARGVTADQSLAQIQAAVAKGPQAFADLINGSKLGTEKFMELNKPTTTTVDQSGQKQIFQTPGLGGTPKSVGIFADVPLPANVVAQKKDIAKSGATNVQTNVNAFTPASEEAQRDFIRSTRTTYDTLKNAPGTIKNIEEAIKLIPSAKGFMGPGGESLLDAASFLNNRLGTNINTKGITDATELRSRLFQGIIENLRKLDANPTENQQNAMRVALGNIGTDPNALPAVLNSFADTVRSKVETHNAEVEGAVSRGVKFPYDPTIKLPTPSAVTTAPAAARPAGVPAEWKLHVDAQGRKAYVSPNGKDFKEVP
jgi:hypothetical protein